MRSREWGSHIRKNINYTGRLLLAVRDGTFERRRRRRLTRRQEKNMERI